MKNKFKNYTLIVILLFCMYTSFILGKHINISNQINAFGVLKDISITIFTIMGIWLAILQSDKFKKIFNIGEPVILNHSEQVWLKNILEPILISSFTLIALVIISIINVIFKPLICNLYIVICLRSSLLFILLILSILNIYSIVISMKPIIVIFRNIIGSKNKLDKIEEHIPNQDIYE